MTQYKETTLSRRRMASYWLTGLGLAMALSIFHGSEWRGGYNLHTNMEIIATMLAVIVGAMALARFYSKKDETFLFIGAGFLGTAFLDGYHTVVTSVFFRPYMPSDLPSLAPWSWVASRQFLSVMLLMSWYFWLRSERYGAEGKISEKTVYILTALFTLACFLFFVFVPLPRAYYPELVFNRPEEFAPALFFLLGLIGYLKKGHWRFDAFEHWLVLSLIVGLVGQALFMSHSGQLFDYEFDVAHLLKKISYICVLIGLMANMYAIFRQADESDARFRGAIESLQESFALYDVQDRLVVFNEEFVRLHSNIQDIIKPGMTFEEVVRTTVKRGFIPAALGREEEFIRERIAQHSDPKEMTVRELSDGSWYLINEAKTPDGGIAVTQTEITELKDAEQALRESEARMKAIIDTVPALINLKDINNRYLMVNHHHSEFFGHGSNELIGKTSIEISEAHDKEIRDLNREVIETGEPTPPYDYSLIDVRGRLRNLLTTKAPLKDNTGKSIGVVSASIDITERIQAEEALRESDARTRAIVDNAIDGIITIDERGTIQSVNPAAEAIFGYSEEELIGRNVNMLAAEPYRSAHDRYLANYLTTNDPKIIGIGREVEGERANGQRFPMDLAVNEVELEGERMFVGIVRDITERQEMDRMKSEFISTVSHELRTPLTSIRGSLGLVTGGAVGKVPKKVQAMINMAEQNTERLINLVNDILDIEKIESGSLEFQFDVIDMLDLIRDEVEANQGYAKQHEVEFVLTQSDPDLVVRGDRNRLNQVLANLLSNAAKFSASGEKIEIAVIRNNGVARVSVSDHGTGIPDEFRKTIFEKFTQADSSDTRQAGGTGLGLNISKTIIEKHDGEIGFYPNQEQGTVFYFDLPLLDEKGGTVTSLPAIVREGSRILICEDDKDIAGLLSMVLEQNGHISDIAYNAAQAETLLGKNNYDALTLDLSLPDKDGIALFRSLREDERTRDLPVIVVSVSADERRDELQNGEAIGIVDWLTKPIDQERLMSAVFRSLSDRNGKHRILYVEDDTDLVSVVSELLKNMADVIAVTTLEEGKQRLASEAFDMVLIDLGLPDGSGADLLPLLTKDDESVIPTIIFSGQDVGQDIAAEVNAVLIKSKTSNEQLVKTIEACIHSREATQE